MANEIEKLDQAAALLAEAIAGLREFKPSLPLQGTPWMDVAREEIGVKEIVGDNHNPRVLDKADLP